MVPFQGDGDAKGTLHAVHAQPVWFSSRVCSRKWTMGCCKAARAPPVGSEPILLGRMQPYFPHLVKQRY